MTHRDLKPENVLLTLDDPPVLKVTDFGLAKLVDENTALKTICGTDVYAAPEVRSGEGPYDQVVDSWSLGVTLAVMCVFVPPNPLRYPEADVDDIAGFLERYPFGS